ncbi:UPF0481 protein At3g47200-like [Juglans microcarpa x Juglans regia]|uniref:UPF0481 protein At3g47200-like n=1 Tax=Juglans microcarpa x Juglans regia TaxID=2249226 RepID=UPI001B7EAF52|nr:UPF0481 protein At3g47200-like [Juglans microcarpa x Juglans regia]
MVAVTYKEYFNQAPPLEDIDSLEAMESRVSHFEIREPEAASTRISTLVVGTLPGKSQQLLNKQQQEPSETLHMVVTDNGDQICEERDNINPADSEWVISVKKKLEQARVLDEAESSREMLCIYRVPHCLREGDEKAYVPQIISLGPYHHGNSSLSQMDLHKWRALQHVLKRNKQEIKLYLDSVKELEKRARASYDGSIPLTSNEFVEMMVLDGCFVIELLMGTVKGFRQLGYSPNDPIFSTRGPIHSIQRDMIKLENQLPLFVLDRLLGLQEDNPCKEGRVAKLIPQFFDALMPTDEPLTKLDGNELQYSESRDQAEEFSDKGGLHCLDVFRRSLLRRSPERPLKSQRWSKSSTFIRSITTVNFVERRQQLVHCVTELREAGIKFKKRKTDRFWEITFDNGTLEIPRILIHDVTKSLLLNLVAFEQRHPNCGNYITSYAVFMDNLINSQQDVAYLHYHGIIEHWLGNDAEVADLFNHLCQEVAFDCRNSYLSSLSEGLNKHFNHKWNVWFASLKHRYFSNPWAVFSLIAAGVLLLLTFLQTLYAVYGYYHPLR